MRTRHFWLVSGVIFMMALVPGFGCGSGGETDGGIADGGMDAGAGMDCSFDAGYCVDLNTGYWWQNQHEQYMKWLDGVNYCTNLQLGGKQWHLPTISELRSLIRDCRLMQTDGKCSVTDGCLIDLCDLYCVGCSDTGSCYWDRNLSWYCTEYISSSTNNTYSNTAWSIDYKSAGLYSENKGSIKAVRCVYTGH